MNQLFANQSNFRLYWFSLSYLLHLIFDFVFQGEVIANQKKGINKSMLVHVFWLTLILTPVFFLYFHDKGKFWLALLIWGSSHLLIDVLKVELSQKYKQHFWRILGADQVFHFLILFFIFCLL